MGWVMLLHGYSQRPIYVPPNTVEALMKQELDTVGCAENLFRALDSSSQIRPCSLISHAYASPKPQAQMPHVHIPHRQPATALSGRAPDALEEAILLR